jgi:hypothetical protein
MTATQQQPANRIQQNGIARQDENPKLAMQYVPFGAKDAIKLSVRIVQEMICVPSRSGKVCNETDALKFMMFCKAKALNPFEGDCYLLGYDSEDGKTASFSLITAHQAYLKRAEVHPEFDGMDSGVIVREKVTQAIVDREGGFPARRRLYPRRLGNRPFQDAPASDEKAGCAEDVQFGQIALEEGSRRNDRQMRGVATRCGRRSQPCWARSERPTK